MEFSISDLCQDHRLTPVFHKKAKTAVQLWVVCDNTSGSYSLVYGWVVPYNFSNNSWTFSKRGNPKSFANCKLQVFCINAYLPSEKLRIFLKAFYGGYSLIEASEKASISIDKDLRIKFGNLKFSENKTLKPTTFISPKSHDEELRIYSPFSSLGTFSASIVSLNKDFSLNVGTKFSKEIYEHVSNILKQETGLDFQQIDGGRVGDVEILSCPVLDEYDRLKFWISQDRDQRIIKATFEPNKNYYQFDHYMLKVDFQNNHQTVQSVILHRDLNSEGRVAFQAKIEEGCIEIIDARVVELYGGRKNDSTYVLLYRSKDIFIRQISFNVTPLSANRQVENSWLTKLTKLDANNPRILAAQSISKPVQAAESHITNYNSDPWVDAQRGAQNSIRNEYPKPSDGKFFPRHTEGEGRLEFVEWWKALFKKYVGKDFVLFDPYFEEAGITLIACHADQNSNVTVITTTSDHSKRIEKIKSTYENLKEFFGGTLQVFSMKHLHDRYLLIREPHGPLLEGFSLSNSIQKANENHPLLVTPVPKDVLWEIHSYLNKLFDQQEEFTKEFCSIEHSKETKIQSLVQTENNCEPIEKTVLFDLIENLKNIGSAEVVEYWQRVAKKIASNDRGELFQKQSLFTEETLEKLSEYLKCRFEVMSGAQSESTSFSRLFSVFAAPVDQLFDQLIGINRGEFCITTKYQGLSWGDFYSVKLLYQYNQSEFLNILESNLSSLDPKSYTPDKVILIGQAISELCFDCMFDRGDFPFKKLVQSENGFLNWVGFSYLEIHLNKNCDCLWLIENIRDLAPHVRIRFIGWLLNRNITEQKRADWHQHLIQYLLNDILPNNPTKTDLELLVEACRGRMRDLGYISFWFLRDIVNPVMNSYPETVDLFTQIWFQEIQRRTSDLKNDTFSLYEQDIITTDIFSQLFSLSSQNCQKEIAGALLKEVEARQRNIRKPMSSFIDYNLWDSSIKLVLWIHGIFSWSHYHSQCENQIFKEVLQLTEGLLLYKPKEYWIKEKNPYDHWHIFFSEPSEFSKQ